MASNKTAEREARVARERLRQYNARQSVHLHKARRRRRDNLLWVAIGVVVITIASVTQVLYFTAGPGVPAPAPVASMNPTDAPADSQQNVGDVPDPSLAEGRTWTGELVLNDVQLGIQLDGAAAPQAVSAIIHDAQDGYFAGKSCHRLTDGGFFVLQCGSLDGTGSGDPEYRFGPIENAPAGDFYPAGTIAMARASGNAYSNGHQFFIVYQDTTIGSDSAGGYSVVGTVTSGLDELIAQITSKGVAGGLSDGEPVVPTVINAIAVR